MNEHFGKCLPPLSYLVSTLLTDSDGSNNVRSSMFDRLKPKIGC